MILNVCKAGIRDCQVNNMDATSLVHSIKIYESMCKPYRTAEITFYNNRGQLNLTGLKWGDDVNFTIYNGRGEQYVMESYFTSSSDDLSYDTVRESMLTITTATLAYFRDQGNRVQASFKNTPATSAAQSVHSQYIGTPLQIMSPSVGMIAQDSIGGYVVTNKSPFTAIREILNRAVYGSVKTGSSLYFENKNGHVIAPAEQLINQLSPTVKLEQRESIGENPMDMFVGGAGENNILISKLFTKDGGIGDISATEAKVAQSAKTVFEQYGRHPFERYEKGNSAFPKGNFALFSKFPGISTIEHRSEARNPKQVDPSIKTLQELAFKAYIKNGTNFLVKTTIEAGMKLTCGDGVEVVLMAPLLDPYGSIAGRLLVADLMHECYFDNREISGTSTIRGVKVQT